MRDAFFASLHRRMQSDPRVFFLTADVGLGTVEKFQQDFPDRFLNVGVAEQNMIGVAAGLAKSGYFPVCYTFSTFITARCYEQVKLDLALHGHPFLLVGSTTGYDHSTQGPTHHAIDDWGLMRNIPGLEIHCPASAEYAAHVADLDCEQVYVRIPKGKAAIRRAFNRPERDKPDTLIVTYGGLGIAISNTWLEVAMDAPDYDVQMLQQLRPLPATTAETMSRYSRIIVAEDHFAETGLYASLAPIVAGLANRPTLESRAPTRYYTDAGESPMTFWRRFGADPDSLRKAVAGERGEVFSGCGA